jgi:Ca2+-binding EF-hand superfamily protein
MKTSKTLLTATLAVALTVPFTAFAAKGDKKKSDTPAAKFAAADKDADGSISEAEYITAMKDKLGEDEAKKHFAELDRNHDGKLTKAEFGGRGGKQGKKKTQQNN